MKIRLRQNPLLPGLHAPASPSRPPHFSAQDAHSGSLDAARCRAFGWAVAAELSDVLPCHVCSLQGHEIQCNKRFSGTSSNGGCRPATDTRSPAPIFPIPVIRSE